MKIIVSGGGTGGHIYPAITIIRSLEKRVTDLEVLYVGTSAGLEADIIPKEGFNFAKIELQGFKRSLSPVNLIRGLKAICGVFTAMVIVRKYKPDIVIGTGGYVCGPVLLAAALLGIPSLIQEQNVIPGITNKILSHFVNKIAVGIEGAKKYFPPGKTVFTGNPIRDEVMQAEREESLQFFSLAKEKKTILVSGGSRGARSINLAMVDVLKHYAGKENMQFLYATGNNDYALVMEKLHQAGVDPDRCHNIKISPYLYDMPKAMAVADLAVFRAGATGLAELTARGIPAILIPYPFAAENHQEFNARSVEGAGAARVILNKDLSADGLIREIDDLLSEEKTLEAMSRASKGLGRPRAAEEIVDIIMALVKAKIG